MMKITTLTIILTAFSLGQAQDIADSETYSLSQSFIKQIDHLRETANFNSESDRLNSFFQFYADYKKSLDPLWAISLGFEGYEARWEKMSLPYIKLSLLENTSIQRVIASFDKSKLSGSDKVYFDLLAGDVQTNIDYVDMEMFYFPIEQQGGRHIQLISIITDHPLSGKKNVESALTLLAGVDKQVDDLIDILKEGLSKDLTIPKITMADVPAQIESISAASVEDNPFYLSFKNLENFSRGEIENYQAQAKSLINERVIPAYKKLYDFITQTYIPACREEVGISSLPGGDKKYAYMIHYHTTTDLTAKEIHELGLSEVKRILSEMEKIRKESGFKGDLGAFNEFLRTDPQFFYTDKETLLKEYRDICKRVDPELVKLFGKLPQLPYGVIPIPEYREKSSTTAYYNGGSLSQGIPGYYYANTYKLETRPSWEMEALSLHEAVPGHHLQIALAQEISGQPEFMKFSNYTAFVEGWGLYAESLGPDLGMYKNPYAKYGQLTYEMWRAVRLVVDTGIHAFGWSRQQAIDFFKANSAKTLNDITVEIDRYIGWPGQALAYKIGELKLKELKALAKSGLGEKFNIRAFHDLVLSEGSLPLSVLENMVNDWIKSQK